MDVILRDRTVSEPKELAEVFDAVEGILKAVKEPLAEGESRMAKIMEKVPLAVAAADGFDRLKEEVKHEAMYEASGAFAGRVAKIFLHKEAV